MNFCGRGSLHIPPLIILTLNLSSSKINSPIRIGIPFIGEVLPYLLLLERLPASRCGGFYLRPPHSRGEVDASTTGEVRCRLTLTMGPKTVDRRACCNTGRPKRSLENSMIAIHIL